MKMNDEKKNFIQDWNKNIIPLVVILSISLISIFLVSAIPLWIGDGFQPPTPVNAISTENNTFIANVSFDETSLKTFIWNFDSVNYTIYDNNLVLMLSMENISAFGDNNTYIADMSLASNNFTVFGLENATWISNGKFGGSYSFNGANGYAITNTAPMNYSLPFTIAFWIKSYNGVNSQASGRAIIGGRGTGSGTYQGAYFGRTGNFINFGIGNATTTVENTLNTDALVFDNNWHHIVGVYNGTNMLLYEDGSVIQTSAILNFVPINPDTPFTIARDSRSSAYYFNGTIDEVLIFNRSLSNTEINQVYRSNLQRVNLTQWKFYINQSQTNDGIITYSAYASDGTNSNITSRTIYYCYPLPNTDWVIDEGNCVSNNKAIGTRTNNITITNNFNLTLKGTNLTADAITIRSGSRLIKSNSSILTIA